MNYQKIYSAFIADRRTTEDATAILGYSELHHVLPRALGGTDDPVNLIRLSPEDHFFAHLLLAKIHGGAMWYGLMAMCVDRYGKRSLDAGYLKRQRKSYDAARRGYAAAVRERAAAGLLYVQTPEWRAKKSEMEKARVLLDGHYMQKSEARAALGARMRAFAAEGKLWAQTPEGRAAMSARMTGRHVGEATRAKLSAKQLGVIPSAESRAKMSASHKAREWTAEDQARREASNKAQVWTEERREKVRESNRTRKVSDETRARISEAHKARGGMATRNKARVWDEAARGKTAAFHRAKATYSALYGIPHRSVTKAMVVEAGIPIEV